jgi:hypothetical protein
MSRPFLKRPAPGTVLGSLALIVALAGNADALSNHVIVRRGDIAKGAVTARALAPGAVRAKALAKGAVTARALKGGAVTAAGLGQDAVTSSAISPGAVYGGALGPVSFHSLPIADIDAVAENGKWTLSKRETVSCGGGERLLAGGVSFSNGGNDEVGIVNAIPFFNGSANGFVGQITSNSGGTAAAEVQAVCLR